MPDELKPCPACGETDVFVMDESDSNIFWVECDNPDCSVHGPWRNSQSDAIAAWNALPRTPQWTEYDGTESTLPSMLTLVLVETGQHKFAVQHNAGGYCSDVDGYEYILKECDRWMPWPED